MGRKLRYVDGRCGRVLERDWRGANLEMEGAVFGRPVSGCGVPVLQRAEGDGDGSGDFFPCVGVDGGETDQPSRGPLDRRVGARGVNLHDFAAPAASNVLHRHLHGGAVFVGGDGSGAGVAPRGVAEAVAERGAIAAWS